MSDYDRGGRNSLDRAQAPGTPQVTRGKTTINRSPPVSETVPSNGALGLFLLFQLCCHAVIYPDSQDRWGWLAWAAGTAGFQLLLFAGMFMSSAVRSAGKMYICSALWGAASIAAVTVSLFFRVRSSHGGECTDRYQLYVQVAILVLHGSLGPWILGVPSMSSALKWRQIAKEGDSYLLNIAGSHTSSPAKDPSAQTETSSSAPLTSEEHFETILRSQARPRSHQGPWHGHMAEIILKSEGFLELTLPKVLEFLSDDRLPTTSELTTFDSAIAWFMHNLRQLELGQRTPRMRAEAHGRALVALMGCVRFGVMEAGDIAAIARSDVLAHHLRADATSRTSVALMVFAGLQNSAHAAPLPPAFANLNHGPPAMDRQPDWRGPHPEALPLPSRVEPPPSHSLQPWHSPRKDFDAGAREPQSDPWGAGPASARGSDPRPAWDRERPREDDRKVRWDEERAGAAGPGSAGGRRSYLSPALSHRNPQPYTPPQHASSFQATLNDITGRRSNDANPYADPPPPPPPSDFRPSDFPDRPPAFSPERPRAASPYDADWAGRSRGLEASTAGSAAGRSGSGAAGVWGSEREDGGRGMRETPRSRGAREEVNGWGRGWDGAGERAFEAERRAGRLREGAFVPTLEDRTPGGRGGAGSASRSSHDRQGIFYG